MVCLEVWAYVCYKRRERGDVRRVFKEALSMATYVKQNKLPPRSIHCKANGTTYDRHQLFTGVSSVF